MSFFKYKQPINLFEFSFYVIFEKPFHSRLYNHLYFWHSEWWPTGNCGFPARCFGIKPPLYLFFFICISLAVQKSVWVFAAIEMSTSYRCVRARVCVSVWVSKLKWLEESAWVCGMSSVVCGALWFMPSARRDTAAAVRGSIQKGSYGKRGGVEEMERKTKVRKLVCGRGRETDDKWKVGEREGESWIQSYIRNPHSKQPALIPIFPLTTGWQDCGGGGLTIHENTLSRLN